MIHTSVRYNKTDGNLTFPSLVAAPSSFLPREVAELLRSDIVCGVLPPSGLDPFATNAPNSSELALALKLQAGEYLY